MYDIVIVLCWSGIVNGIIGIPIIYFLTKKAQKEENSELFRMLHSMGFDFNDKVLEKINKSDSNTRKLFSEFKLYLYDKFSQQLKSLKELDNQEELIIQLNKLLNQYEKDKNETDS